MKKKYRTIRVCGRDWAWRANNDFYYSYGWAKIWDSNKRVIFEGKINHTNEHAILPSDIAKTIKDYLISCGDLSAEDHFLEVL